MKYLIPLLLCCFVILPCLTLPAAESVVVVPVDGAVVAPDTPTPAVNPQASLRRMTRAERKLALEVIDDAAKACGMRRLEFMRAVKRGDAVANDELKLSLAANEDAREIDVDRLRELLQVILDFISQLLAIFGMFADNQAVLPDAAMLGMMALPPETCGIDQRKPDQALPAAEKAPRRPLRRVRAGIDVRTPRLHVHVGRRACAV